VSDIHQKAIVKYTNRLTWTLEFPSNNAVPLIQLQRQVSMTLDPFRIICCVLVAVSLGAVVSLTRVHGGLGRRANGDVFLEFGLTTDKAPSGIQNTSHETLPYALVTQATSGENPSM
jgi:hypothetical protein